MLCAVLIFTLALPAYLISLPEKAEAQLATVEVNSAPNLFESIITAVETTASSISNYTLQYKETVLDGIAWYVAKAIIRQMTTSIVNWINSGFDGNPSFITDPAGIFINAADQEIGKFIAGSSDLNFLCAPFSIDIRIALAFKYSPFKQKITCTFTDIIRNTKNAVNGFNNTFVKGNFEQGGWKNWITLTQEPQNNYIGAYIQAEQELSIRVANKKISLNNELNWGKGFLSFKTCDQYATETTGSSDEFTNAGDHNTGDSDAYTSASENVSTTKTKTCLHQSVQTPGSVIESGLETTLGSGIRQLELADEFNEIVNALFAQMLKTVLGGGGGLKGTSGSGSFDSSSYINQVSQEQASQQVQEVANIKSNSTPGVQDSITKETNYKAYKQAALDSALKVKDLLIATQECYQKKLSTDQVPPLTDQQKQQARTKITEAGSMITQSVDPVSGPLIGEVASVTSLLEKLTAIKVALDNAKTVNDTATPTADYQNLISSKALHDTGQIMTANQDKDKVVGQMSTLQAQANVKLQECRAFPAGTSSVTPSQED